MNSSCFLFSRFFLLSSFCWSWPHTNWKCHRCCSDISRVNFASVKNKKETKSHCLPRTYSQYHWRHAVHLLNRSSLGILRATKATHLTVTWLAQFSHRQTPLFIVDAAVAVILGVVVAVRCLLAPQNTQPMVEKSQHRLPLVLLIHIICII